MPKRALTCILLAGFWAFVPSTPYALGFDESRHLLTRTGFLPLESEIHSLAGDSYEAGVDRLLRGVRTRPVTPLPGWAAEPLPDRRKLKQASDEERKAFRKRNRRRGLELKGWWYREMLATDSPLTERMTLFWHNHFTSSLKKVKSPRLMLSQNLLLREHALGNFGALLQAIARDPAMIIYLDNRSNRKGRPNENFTRELLELFTLGEGQYSEQDIKEAARAFTGWGVDRQTGEFRLRRRQHDSGEKVFMGQRGPWNGGDIIRILLQQPRTAEHITGKVWREFLAEEPDPAELQQLARDFRQSGYAIAPLVKGILMSGQFRAAGARGTRIKSPVELLVGTVRFFAIPVQDGQVLARVGHRLGQDIMDPPNVKGWAGGANWIDSNTLLLRRQALERFSRGKEMGKREGSGMRRAKTGGLDLWSQAVADTPSRRQHLRRLLLALPPTREANSGTLQEYLGELLLDPVYQLN